MARSLREELQQSKPFKSLESEAYVNLVRTHSLLADGVNRLFKEHGVTQALYNLLRIVRGAGGEGIACTELSQRLVTRVPDVTRLVDRLVKADLITRNPSETDRRVVLLIATSKGLDLLDRMEEPMLSHHHERMAHMTAEELKNLIALLTKLRNA
jgi:DNA-binding MarR family transcriptional regulator